MYRLTMPDNDVYFFRGQKDRKRCPVCGQLIAKREENLMTTPIRRRPRFDVSCSVDGGVVVTGEGRDALEGLFHGQVRLDALQSGLFSVWPKTVVRFDAQARKTRFEGP